MMAGETLDQVLELGRISVDDLGGDCVDDDGAVWLRWGERRLFDLVRIFGDFEGGGAGALELKLFFFRHNFFL